MVAELIVAALPSAGTRTALKRAVPARVDVPAHKLKTAHFGAADVDRVTEVRGTILAEAETRLTHASLLVNFLSVLVHFHKHVLTPAHH